MSNCDNQSLYLPSGECDACDEYINELRETNSRLQTAEYAIADLQENLSEYVGSFATYAELSVQSANNNDYAVVLQDETHDNKTTRYIYKSSDSSWEFQYVVNNAPFTQAQQNAIDSGITSGKVSTYDTAVNDTLPTHDTMITDLALLKLNKSTTSGKWVYYHSGSIQTELMVHSTLENDSNLVTSGGVYNALAGLLVLERRTLSSFASKTLTSLGYYNEANIDISKSGYTALGIMGSSMNSDHIGVTRSIITQSTQKLTLTIHNLTNSSQATGSNCYVDILYVKNYS